MRNPVHRLTTLLLASLVVALSGCCLLVPHAPSTSHPKFLSYSGTGVEVVPGNYMVMFDAQQIPATAVASLTQQLIAGTGGQVEQLFTVTMRGAALRNLDDAWAARIAARPEVRSVRKDFRIYGREARGNAFGPVPWNLDRIDQRAAFTERRDYRFKTAPSGAAAPIPIYILDNGIHASHDEFAAPGGSRVVNVQDHVSHNFTPCALPVADRSHGTAIAAIAAGNRFGITSTQLFNVVVLGAGPFGDTCTAGSVNRVAQGLESVAQHMMNVLGAPRAVVNLSVGWTASASVPDVRVQIAALQAMGVVVVAAAGNENLDAASVEPANIPGVLVVGATTINDARWVELPGKGSNFGPIVGLWAPGLDIQSAAWLPSGSDSAFDSFTGTSMAAPHVAGALALLWQQQPSLTKEQAVAALKGRATRHTLTGLGAGSTDSLLFVGDGVPAASRVRDLPRGTTSGTLHDVRFNANRTHLLLAAGDRPGAPAPFAAASLPETSFPSAPLSQAVIGAPPLSHCVKASDSSTKAYFACMQDSGNSAEAVVVAVDAENAGVTLWRRSLGSGSRINSVLWAWAWAPGGSVQLRVYALITQTRTPPTSGTEVRLMVLDPDNGQMLSNLPLAAAGFSGTWHSGVDLAVVEAVTNTAMDLVVASRVDDPGSPKSSHMWRLDPITLQVNAWQQVNAPGLSQNGLYASALAFKEREDNFRGIVVPAEVYLAALAIVQDGGRLTPWTYIYRMNADRVSVRQEVDVIKDAIVEALWTGDADLYFCGGTTREFNADPLHGTRKPGAAPDFDAFIGKSEALPGWRRWMRSYRAADSANASAVCSGKPDRAFLATHGTNDLHLVEYLLH